jgi:excisionase family DNA binding protein
MKLLTVKELSQFLSVAEKTLYQWVELRQIPCLKLNGSIRFDYDDVQLWIESCKIESNIGYNPFNQGRGPRKGGKQ